MMRRRDLYQAEHNDLARLRGEIDDADDDHLAEALAAWAAEVRRPGIANVASTYGMTHEKLSARVRSAGRARSKRSYYPTTRSL
jgi:DNA-binding phage protein